MNCLCALGIKQTGLCSLHVNNETLWFCDYNRLVLNIDALLSSLCTHAHECVCVDMIILLDVECM